MTIASEEFVNGGDFFPPGAALTLPGVFTDAYWRNYTGTSYGSSSILDYHIAVASSLGYGMMVNWTEYETQDSALRQNITAAATAGSSWDRLEIQDCYAEYYTWCVESFCYGNGLKSHKDVILVVDRPDGWVRDDMWHLKQDESTFWDQIGVSGNRSNHLFYDAQCIMVGYDTTGSGVQCDNQCSRALNSSSVSWDYPLLPLETAWDYSFLGTDQELVNGSWRSNMSYTSVSYIPSADFNSKTSGLVPGALDISVQYCLAEPLPNICHVAVSPAMLLGVTICVIMKTIAAYNTLFTRLQMAREWSTYSEGYQALRVTDPKGQQFSTYRLQLPYKYSLPLIGVSIFLHWLLSNTIYVFVSIGGYYGTSEFLHSQLADPTLPANTVVAIGYSTKSLLTLLVVSCFLIVTPVILSLKRLPRNMINIGCNSLAISAACHASPGSYAAKTSPLSKSPASSRLDLPPSPYTPAMPHGVSDLDNNEFENSAAESIELQRMGTHRAIHSVSSDTSTGRYEDRDDEELAAQDDMDGSSLRELSRSRIRWGVVEMPPEWYEEYNHEGQVEHLGFGVKRDHVQPPVAGRWYA
ncbi:hypothetical protein F5Y15DRAFT_410610 [Xylariaceae sp. FL0016]|nr:hypothetical protein F5Y15DRAFT_410610 [Xylariaceae sp. FL0016]